MGIVADEHFHYRGVPKRLVLRIRDEFGVRSFVETGTYSGDTALWAAAEFESVVTIEASEQLYMEFARREVPEHLVRVRGDSSVVLKEHLPGSSVIYLDAHHSAGATFNSYPLLKEIDQLNATGFDDFIIVDDARHVMSLWHGERYCTLTELVERLSRKDRYVVIFDDAVIAVPMRARSVVDEYTDEISRGYWMRCVEDGLKKIRKRRRAEWLSVLTSGLGARARGSL